VSNRTLQNQLSKPWASSTKKPDRFNRRVEHKRVRRQTQVALSQMTEPEDLVLPRPVNTATDIEPSEKPPKAKANQKRFKVWKTKDWKRRSLARKRKALQYKASRK